MVFNNIILLTEAESLGDIMARAGLNTIMGLGIVFVALVLIALIISLEGKIFVALNKAKAAPKVVEKQEAPAEAQTEEVDDEEEIAAVITAAIYAYEAETGVSVAADGLVVRSIRRRR